MLAEEILNKITGFDQCEVYVEKTTSQSFELKNATEYSKGFEESYGCSVRLQKDNKLAFVYFDISSKDKIDDIMLKIKDAIGYTKTNSGDIIPEHSFKYTEDEKILKVDEESTKELLMQTALTAEKTDRRIKQTKEVAIDFFSKTIQIANSNGLGVQYSRQSVSAAIEVLAEDKISDLAYYALDGEKIEDIDLNFMANKAANLAVNKLYPNPIQTKKYSVIIANNTFRDILAHFLPIFNGYSVVNHTTQLEGKIGKKVFSDAITIIDAKQMPNRPNNIPFDEEGSPAKDTVVVENGYLKSFLHNTYTASLLKMENTSNAKRGNYKNQPKVGPFNLYVKPNEDVNRDKLLNMIDGIYIIDVMGLHMANVVSGDFSFGINGFLIHNGEPVSYFKAATFAGNFFDIAKKVIAVSNNLYFLGSVGSPDVAVADCIIGG
ncbi:TldD/PmbA family protein [Hippea jasoniae]|uniref:TldD/PmbA family protein n=1 Tax=Hippea jasoniae TaxID=944479 RepID=UPI000AE3AFDA|nr:TldD/PmbA family protein [Hippea jasoniae]